MILYFADRQLNIVGHASTTLPKGFTVSDDKKSDEVETGVSTFECTIPFTNANRAQLEECAAVGNHIILKDGDQDKLYTITEAETDTRDQELRLYAEDDGMDLLNEVVGAYEADKAYPIDHYINKYAAGAGFVIGINEAKGLTRQLSWDGESTASARVASVATQFDGCEISFSFEVDGLRLSRKIINIYKKRGKDLGVTLRLNREIDRIITTKSITNLATALQCTGGTPEDTNLEDDKEPVPVTLKGYSYDDGDFFVDTDGLLKSRNALKKWSRFLWKTDDSSMSGGHIVKQFSYDTTNQKTLCAHAVTELKKICDVAVNYEADITDLPDSVRIGDRINIVDDHGELYLSTRILKLETSETRQERQATFGEYLIKGSGISQKVVEISEQFAKTSVSAARALALAKNAKSRADAAKEQAESAVADSQAAQQAAEAARTAANAASSSASVAEEKAAAAQQAAQRAEESVSAAEQTVSDAQAAVQQAQQAASTAETKATEAQQSAVNAGEAAQQSATYSQAAQEAAQNATAKSEEAKTAAGRAIESAQSASSTAAAAKLDAEQAKKDVVSLGNDLATLENTMSVEFARKTDLTKTEARLQTSISQNAADIKSTATKFQVIDETANDAAALAAKAQEEAAAAQEEADRAAADAAAAQVASDEAAAAAQVASDEAAKAQAAADAAHSVADKAGNDLAAAQEALTALLYNAGATVEEIEAAQKAVSDAQAASMSAIIDAQRATTIAEAAQTAANNAVASAEAAQTAANNARADAETAQKVADEANGAAVAADVAMSAAVVAGIAQSTADTARTNADAAQLQADNAAQEAQAALSAAQAAAVLMEQAAADLADAEQRLANVLADANSTAEEVEAAQAVVESARSFAIEAEAAADAAQTEAANANTNAEAARVAAIEAEAAAEAAQAAASVAKKATAQAAADVNKLAVRLTNATTEIRQNAEKISLMATKQDVAETLGGYSTKEETQAAINIAADEISSQVRKVYATKGDLSGIEVGARNLIRHSATLQFDNYYFEDANGATSAVVGRAVVGVAVVGEGC